MSDAIVIVSAARTPIAGLLGDFSNLAAWELGAVAIKAAAVRDPRSMSFRSLRSRRFWSPVLPSPYRIPWLCDSTIQPLRAVPSSPLPSPPALATLGLRLDAAPLPPSRRLPEEP